jgi:hypothetical protein
MLVSSRGFGEGGMGRSCFSQLLGSGVLDSWVGWEFVKRLGTVVDYAYLQLPMPYAEDLLLVYLCIEEMHGLASR